MTHGPGTGDAEDGRQGRLTRERVLAAALDLVDREGPAALTMRRLGAELGVEAMSLYRYAPGKNALLDGVAEALYLELENRLAPAPRPAAAPGPALRAELHRIALVTYQVCLDHPEGTLLIFSRMTRVPLARRPPPVLRNHERVLALLQNAGYGPVHSARIWRAFTAWVLGYVSVELQTMVDNPSEPDPAFRLGLYRMSSQELPRLRTTTPALAKQGGADALATGLDTLLDRFL
ncbi:TetR/AcrR family transcriptional regulator [Streptomyces sp. NPDC093094]|uniref:TetR/AcrR family transcriptional regulator n=1 Tax=Streptomyces sp. NPDC093094 TaxID=3366026 RepID=UPI003822E6DB